MKIAISQFESGKEYEHNVSSRVLVEINKAKLEGASIIIFPEDALSISNLHSLTQYKSFMRELERRFDHVLKGAPDDIFIFISRFRESKKGSLKKVYSLFKKKNKKVEFHLSRSISFKEDNFSFLFDANIEGESISFFSQNRFPKKSNVLKRSLSSRDFAIISASVPFIKNLKKEFTILKNFNSSRTIFVNSVSSEDEKVYFGGSFFKDKNKGTEVHLPYFESCLKIINTKENNDKEVEAVKEEKNILDAITFGIRCYAQKNGFKGLHLGLSGGIDSALVACIACYALGNENVKVFLMPSDFSSEGSITDAKKLCKNLNIKYEIIPIKELYDLYKKTMFAGFKKESRLQIQNIQARIRGNLLMGYSNVENSLLLETGNKSEALAGYCTLYGDTCGGIAPIGDLYKKEVYEMAKFINRDGEVIPKEIIEKEPSAELEHGQKDEDHLPAKYEILDRIMFEYIEKRKMPNKMDFVDEETAKEVISLIRKSEYKRRQLPPAIKLKKSSFKGSYFPI